ncbi:type II toxin-antitoxin system VapC family toxin [Gloeocapsa sp. PCC 73106]|uniref:type II toxin-antitoxin system VapC family toxin n=1 Tax=Gloeocapsa sp. PCC 73106 TaxID=102232 RepID=UPI0002ABA512|nr:PIN domain-containing protein [Gloeocapsa sp. PCC 73106]ELR97286.1 putative nucleic acid-binding protein [Gloeocapsa sp. PCC 73106]
MKNIYFLDTSYILALEIRNEGVHQQVLKNWADLAKTKPFLVTTTYIFDEVVTFLNSRNFHYKAVEVGNRLLESNDIDLVEIGKNLFNQGWEYFQKHQDKSYSLTDCLSFILMKERKIVTALTLDNHFLQAGFETLP